MSREAEATARALAMQPLQDNCEDPTNVIRVLHLEDNPDDQEIIRCSLAQGGLSCFLSQGFWTRLNHTTIHDRAEVVGLP